MHKRLLTLLTVCGLIFALGGCHSEPDAEELKQQELRELEARIPSYYLTADEIGEGYRFWARGQVPFTTANCMEGEIAFPLGESIFGFASYKDPETSRSVSVEAGKLPDFYNERDFNALLSPQFDEECPKEWTSEDRQSDWHVSQATKVEGLSHNAFGFRATEQTSHHQTSPPPHPPQSNSTPTKK